MDPFVVKEFSPIHSKIQVLSPVLSPIACKGERRIVLVLSSGFCLLLYGAGGETSISYSPFLVVAASVVSTDWPLYGRYPDAQSGGNLCEFFGGPVHTHMKTRLCAILDHSEDCLPLSSPISDSPLVVA